MCKDRSSFCFGQMCRNEDAIKGNMLPVLDRCAKICGAPQIFYVHIDSRVVVLALDEDDARVLRGKYPQVPDEGFHRRYRLAA